MATLHPSLLDFMQSRRACFGLKFFLALENGQSFLPGHGLVLSIGSRSETRQARPYGIDVFD